MALRPKLIVIVGPTASGKSELAVRLAKKLNGEIISADSRQVYRGLDIGTGKVSGRWKTSRQARRMKDTARARSRAYLYKNIPHYCIDFANPKTQYSVAEFKKCAKDAIREIIRKGKNPIIAGGAGFWIDAAVYDLNLPEVPPDIALRKKLARKSVEELLFLLKRIDPIRAKNIEQKNPRRLIRAIEIAKILGKVPLLKKTSRYRALWIGIKLSAEELKKRIGKRIHSRMKKGMVKEAERLHKQGISWLRFYELGLEYRLLADLLQKKLARKQFLTGLERASNQYARRQMVWSKRNKKIHWIKNPQEAEKYVKFFLKNP